VNKRSGQESRKKILSAAARVFSVNGYKGASMRVIAKGAGISAAGLYLYFKNKEDLYTTLVRNKLHDLTAEIRETLSSIKDPVVAMSTFISMRVNYARKHRELIFVLGREQGFAFGIRAKSRFFREQRKAIEEIIIKGIAAGVFRPCNVKEIAKIIICALRGYILSIIVEPDALFSPEECSEVILKGLLSDKAGTRICRSGIGDTKGPEKKNSESCGKRVLTPA
jgi:AcrR family transcriptional regulator